jgi:hypothetical protein
MNASVLSFKPISSFVSGFISNEDDEDDDDDEVGFSSSTIAPSLSCLLLLPPPLLPVVVSVSNQVISYQSFRLEWMLHSILVLQQLLQRAPIHWLH